MKTLKEQYEDTVLKRKNLSEQKKILEENAAVKRYFALQAQEDELANQQRKLYKAVKEEEYSSCRHIWVTTLQDYDMFESRIYNYCGCMKCGLDSRVFYLMEHYQDFNRLTPEQQIMYQFMRNGQAYERGINTHVSCDLDLARAIYSKLKEAHPDIDDKTATKYFRVAFDDIRNIEVSDERKTSRAKRLSLGTRFNNWPK